MTLPDERLHAVISTRKFLLDLLYPSRTPRVPLHIRQEAGYRLRHYPNAYNMEKKYIKGSFYES